MLDGNIPVDWFDNYIRFALDYGWQVDDFVALGVRGRQFHSDTIDLAIEHGWQVDDFVALGVRGDQFDESNFLRAIAHGWRGATFAMLDGNIPVDRFENYIRFAIACGWTDEDFEALGIRR